MRLALIALVASLALAACSSPSSSSSPPSSDSGAPCLDAGATPADAGPAELDAAVDASPPADAAEEPCALRVDTLTPATVHGGELVVMRGCGFLGVRDVEVNVYSVPFTVIDDETITFTAWDPAADGLELELPYAAAVDVIRRQPDQVQATLTYR